MRFTWSASDSTIEYYGGEEKRKPAWHCRRRHTAAAAPLLRPLGANGGATTGCRGTPTAPPDGKRRGAATGNFDGRRVPKLFIATATTPLVLLVLLKTVAYRGLDVALLSGRISSGAHC